MSLTNDDSIPELTNIVPTTNYLSIKYLSEWKILRGCCVFLCPISSRLVSFVKAFEIFGYQHNRFLGRIWTRIQAGGTRVYERQGARSTSGRRFKAGQSTLYRRGTSPSRRLRRYIRTRFSYDIQGQTLSPMALFIILISRWKPNIHSRCTRHQEKGDTGEGGDKKIRQGRRTRAITVNAIPYCLY